MSCTFCIFCHSFNFRSAGCWWDLLLWDFTSLHHWKKWNLKITSLAPIFSSSQKGNSGILNVSASLLQKYWEDRNFPYYFPFFLGAILGSWLDKAPRKKKNMEWRKKKTMLHAWNCKLETVPIALFRQILVTSGNRIWSLHIILKHLNTAKTDSYCWL